MGGGGINTMDLKGKDCKKKPSMAIVLYFYFCFSILLDAKG